MDNKTNIELEKYVFDKKPIYLDSASTTPVDKFVLEKTIPYMTTYYGNPSSSNSFGMIAKKKIQSVRENISDYLNSYTENIYFTSSASESNSWAIHNFFDNYSGDIIMDCTVHADIRSCVYDKANLNQLVNVYECSVQPNGKLDTVMLEHLCSNCAEKNGAMVIVSAVNSEIGTVQDLEYIGKIADVHGCYFMVDATQAITHMDIDVEKMHIDVLTFGGHKIGAMKGIGVMCSNMMMSNLIYGHQENGHRGSTENVPGIVSIDEALKLHKENNYNKYVMNLKNKFKYEILSQIDDCYVVGQDNNISSILCVCFKGCDSLTLQSLLDSYDNIYVSVGSACSSYNKVSSGVLKSIGMKAPDIHCCVRFSFHKDLSNEDICNAVFHIKKEVFMLRKMNSPEE